MLNGSIYDNEKRFDFEHQTFLQGSNSKTAIARFNDHGKFKNESI